MYLTRFALLTLTVLASLVSSSFAEVPEQGISIVRLPYTIQRPGTYVVRRDLVYRAVTGAAITINADNVILDLGGRTLTYTPPATVPPPTGNAVVALAHNNITVRHGTLSGFVIGIKMNPIPVPGRMLIENVECDASSTGGIQIDSGDSVEVRQCRVRNTGSVGAMEATGLYAIGNYVRVTGNDVTNTLAQGSGCRGLLVGGLATLTTDNRVVNSTLIASSFGIGIFGSNSSPTNAENFLKNNTIAGFGTGIVFANSASGKYQDNLTANCTTAFSGGTSIGTNN